MEERLQDLYNELTSKKNTMIGYPANQSYDFSDLYDFFKLSINNIGDPLGQGPYKIKAHEFEKEVVTYFAELTKVNTNNFWGYVTNGGTEGNMYGLYMARELYPDHIVYYSRAAHYSIPKILKLLKMPAISVATNDKDEMCIKDLQKVLEINRTKTPIILATVGTTMTGAVDPLEKIKNLLDKMAFINSYIHCDAALSGMILPFCKTAPSLSLSEGIDSISVSGHKMIGTPMPCGIVLTHKNYVDRIGSSIEYIGAKDTTLSGSRNGHSTILLWNAIKQNNYQSIVEKCLQNADYLIHKLSEIGVNCWRHRYSITVVLEKPDSDIIEKWQLATQRNIAHIICMPHVTKNIIDDFTDDLIKKKL